MFQNPQGTGQLPVILTSLPMVPRLDTPGTSHKDKSSGKAKQTSTSSYI